VPRVAFAANPSLGTGRFNDACAWPSEFVRVVTNALPFLDHVTGRFAVGGCVSMLNVTVAFCSPAFLDAPTFVKLQVMGVSPATA
jgi:hypothetical protein